MNHRAGPDRTCPGRVVLAGLVLAVAGPDGAIITPCGGCRQKLREFSRAEVRIHSCDPAGVRQTVTIGDLLPHAFAPEHLK